MAASDQFPHSRQYRDATQMVFGSGSRLLIEAGANITMPNTLARGYIPLVAVGVKTTATASGIVPWTATSVSPKLSNPDITSGFISWQWATAAVNPMYFAPVRVPEDLATAGGMEVHVVAQSASGATNQLNVAVRAGTATANVGTTQVLTSSPVESTIAITSGNTPSSGLVSVSIFPSAHATGVIDFYTAGISYQKRTS
jgi:hypothetical protein